MSDFTLTFIDLSPFCLTVKWLKSHKKSRKKSRKSLEKSIDFFLTFYDLFFDWVVKFQLKKVIKNQLKVIDCILTFFDFFLTLKSEKVAKLLSQSHDQNTEYFFVQKTPPTTNSLEKELMVVDKMTKAALSSLGIVFGIALKKILVLFNWGNGKKKKNMYSVDNGLEVLLEGLLHLGCLHDVYKL